jgi:asparaginyl-tRNA synthetase
MTNSIKNIFDNLDNNNDKLNNITTVFGWVRTVRSSSNILGFSVINDGSNVSGLQIILSSDFMEEDEITNFFKNVNIGTYLNCTGKLILSPAKGQKYEMQLLSYEIKGKSHEDYPLTKTKINLDTLRNYIHLRGRTNTFGSIFRLRSSLTKIIHDFYHNNNFLHLDPNIITMNECEGGAGVFQLTENDISIPSKLKLCQNKIDYDWHSDHFTTPTYLTVSSQLQLEALACSMGNVYTMNKSFRSEHSSTTKHVSEFTHLEIEMINITLDDLMNISEKMIKYSIEEILKHNEEDIINLDSFISKGLLERLIFLKTASFKKIKYHDAIIEINNDIHNNPELKIQKLNEGDDMSSEHENYITKKYNTPIFLTHWPIKIKSFYMKQCNDENETCESFDLLMPYGIGELIGASMREDDYNNLISMMKIKNVSEKNMEFYTDLRRFGTCPHGGFGLGFDRLLMLITGMQNIKDVIPFPIYYKNCKY